MPDAEPARPELPGGWPHILRAIVSAPQWWITRNDLARKLSLHDRRGRPLVVLANRIEAMLAAKWLDPWEHEHKAAVTLSTLAAARLGCKLTQPEDPAVEPRWIDSAAVLWPRANPQRQFVDVDVAVFNAIFDPQPTPAEHAEEAEAFRREAQAAIAELLRGESSRFARLLRARPRILLMGCETLWWEQTVERGAEFRPRPFCPCCKGLPLLDGAICLHCFRWFLDEFFAWKPAKSRAA